MKDTEFAQKIIDYFKLDGFQVFKAEPGFACEIVKKDGADKIIIPVGSSPKLLGRIIHQPTRIYKEFVQVEDILSKCLNSLSLNKLDCGTIYYRCPNIDFIGRDVIFSNDLVLGESLLKLFNVEVRTRGLPFINGFQKLNDIQTFISQKISENPHVPELVLYTSILAGGPQAIAKMLIVKSLIGAEDYQDFYYRYLMYFKGMTIESEDKDFADMQVILPKLYVDLNR